MKNSIDIARKLIAYNLKIIFGNKFVYFLLAAIIFYLLLLAGAVFDDDGITEVHVYQTLLFPGILLIFYPTTFAIQNDADQRTLEIIFGIPDYRYKVWLFRMVMIFVMAFIILLPLASFSMWALVPTDLGPLLWHLTCTLVFLGVLSFGVSTIIRNGNGSAVVMVIVGLGFLIMSDSLYSSMWNIFLNPYDIVDDLNEIVYNETLRNNHIFLLCSALVFLLIGLLNLQKREKFV